MKYNKKKIGVLTSGGDSPGMNTYLTHLVAGIEKEKIELVAFNNGYNGLIENNYTILNSDKLSGSFSHGGSVIKTGRSKEFLNPIIQKKAVDTLREHNISVLIVIGGNGTFKGAQRLAKSGVKVIAIPGTIDNDLNFTEKSLGFDTALSNAVSAIDKIKDTVISNDRGVVIEVMGRDSGSLALYAAAATNADMVIVNEIDHSKKNIIQNISNIYESGVKSPVIIVAENIIDISKAAKDAENITGIEFKSSVIGYLQRGGAPTVYDRKYALELAVETIKNIKTGNFDSAIGIRSGKIYSLKLKNVFNEEQNFDYGLYNLFLALKKL